jgi:hypothetical protein
MSLTALLSRRPRALRFVRHYGEMVAAMFLGMLVLGVPAAIALGAMGIDVSTWRADAPALLFAGMAITMTVPMVGWMRYRGHGWAPAGEMTAAMLLPTFGVLALLASGSLTDVGTLMMLEHVVMPVAMLVVMLLRLDEYAGAPSSVVAG